MFSLKVFKTHVEVKFTVYFCRKLFKEGDAVQWNVTLKESIGNKISIDVSSFLNYLKPALKKIRKYNEDKNNTIGWPDYSWYPPPSK